jgi:hypothetical protein
VEKDTLAENLMWTSRIMRRLTNMLQSGACSACDHSGSLVTLRGSHRERGAAARAGLCAHDDADVASEDGQEPDQPVR